MNVLLTNDDGLCDSILEFKDFLLTIKSIKSVIIIVPSKEMSGKSHGVTIFNDIYIECVEENIYIVDGYPSDCVRVGLLSNLFNFNLVISGINLGLNIGLDIYYSGTIAASRESSFHKIPSLAFSIDCYKKDVDLSISLPFIKNFLLLYFKSIKNLIPSFTFFNINIPYKKILGIKWTILSMTTLQNKTKNKFDHFIYNKKNTKYYFNYTEIYNEGSLDTDLRANQDNYISITPLNVNTIDFNTYLSVKKITF